jgi:hypothetical protein
MRDGTNADEVYVFNKTLNWLLVNLDKDNIPALAQGGTLGFFNGTTTLSSTELNVTNLSTAATLAQTIDKLNDLITTLKSYNLV